MKFYPAPLHGSYVIQIEEKGDERGWFGRTYCRETFEKEMGHTKPWVQMNHSLTAVKGTIRGMHFQKDPAAEIKLVRCVAGAVFDVVVDLRNGSPTFLQWFGVEISASNKKMMYIPEGFAHGFQTLEDNTELVYSHSVEYTPAAESGIMFNDPALKIEWPLPVTEVSDRDRTHKPIITDQIFYDAV